MENLVPIGRFATLCRLSPKALRLYGESGLLPPAWIDPASGYRYYALSQARSAHVIRLLRSAGMPLVQIGQVLGARSAEDATRLVRDHAMSLRREAADRERIFEQVRLLLEREEEEMAVEVRVKSVDAQPMVSVSKEVSIGELPAYIESSVAALQERTGPVDRCFVVYHGEVNDERDGVVEVAVPVGETHAEGHLPAGEVAYAVAKGEDTRFPAIIGYYDAIAAWVRQSGRRLAGPPREVYTEKSDLQDPDQVEIAWPIE